MNKPIRFTSEKQQELISRNQFCERLIEFGWIPVSPEDLGEDFIVHFYFEGQATGASFYVQEKSVTNLPKRQKGQFLPYSFEVKDLKHWENFVQPVVLIVWDIKLREGRWMLLKDAIRHIDQTRPKWRAQKKTQVYIPWNNTTDNNGLVKLRHKVGNIMFPIIGKDKELSMKMTLNPLDMWEDKEMAKSFERFYDEGEEVTLRGDVIKSIEVPDWAKPWFNTDFTEITMESLGSSESLPVDISIITSDGKTETMKGIELKFVKRGSQTMYLSNEHQAAPLMFKFVFSSSKDCSVSVSLNNLGGNVNVTRDILHFKQALSRGGKLQLFSIKHNKPLPIDVPVPYQPEFSPDSEYIKLIDYLCVIQAKTGQFIKLESDVFSKRDLQTIAELLTIIEQGKLMSIGKRINKQFEVEPPEDIFDYLEQKKPISLTVTHDNSSGELLGQKIEMGKAIEQITGTLDMAHSELEKAIEIYKTEGILPLRLTDVESVVTFPNWVKKSKNRKRDNHQ
jgi:hypothetical protein